MDDAGESLHLLFPTNDDLTCVAIQGPSSGYAAFKADIAASIDAYLDQVPVVALPSFEAAVAAASLALPPEVYEMRAAMRAQPA